MNCIYCHKHLAAVGQIIFIKCDQCSTGISRVSYWFYMGEILEVEFTIINKRLISISVEEEKCTVFSATFDELYRLDHLPFITPSNVHDWSDRMDRLQVFT